MTELQFINAMSDEHRTAVIANSLMDYGSRKHHLAVYQAKKRQDARDDNRYTRSLRRAAILDTAVMAATVVGIAVATWFLSAIGAA